MTGIQTNVSPLKGTAEGRRIREREISRALKGNTPRRQGKARKVSIVWVSSGDEDEGNNNNSEDEDLIETMKELSVKPPVSTLPEYSAIATPPRTPVRALSRASQSMNRPASLTASSGRPVSPPPTPAPASVPATPGRQGKFNAYVVYSGLTPHFYANWGTVKRMLEADQTLVFKGFYTLDSAREAWLAARNSGVITAIRNGVGRPYWSVTEGVNPAVYGSVYEALKVGLEWGGGCLKGWHNKEDAVEDWNDKAQASPSRIIDMPSPKFSL